jgi:NADH dehydrogenase (ubiquinone) 1 alpha subcomplex subunit 6
MEIYDICHIGSKDIRAMVRTHFYKHKDVKDYRVIRMLIEKGYIELEDTMLQHKQKTHVMLLLEGPGEDLLNKRLKPDSTVQERIARNMW